MASSHTPWWKRPLHKYAWFLFKKCPGGNYHWRYARICYCMYHEYCGTDGGVFDFKFDIFIKGDIKNRDGR